MPVSTSDPRRTTIIGVIGLVVGTILIVVVLFAGNLGGGDKTTNSKANFNVGNAEDHAAAVAKDGPIGFNDTADTTRPIFVQHTGDDPQKGWSAFDAVVRGGCVLTWHQDTHDFTDCDGKRVPSDGGALRHYNVSVNSNGDVVVDLSIDDATTTTSS